MNDVTPQPILGVGLSKQSIFPSVFIVEGRVTATMY